MTRQLIAVTVLTSLVMARAAGQTLTAPSEWIFSGGEGSYCVSYLMSPETAAKVAPKETVFSPAGRGDGLHAAVMRQVQDEPEFAKWIPAQVCVGRYQSVSINGQQVAVMKPGKPILMVSHSLATTSYRGTPVPAVMLGLYTDNGDVSRGGERVGQVMKKVSQKILPTKAGQDPRVMVEFDGVKLIWQGSPSGSPRVISTRKVSFGYTAQRGNDWLGELEESGGEGFSQYGALGVEGKNTLAKALLSSPIRAMGALERGRSGKLSLAVVPRGGSGRD